MGNAHSYLKKYKLKQPDGIFSSIVLSRMKKFKI